MEASMIDTNRERYSLDLEAMPDNLNGVPANLRLRRALKYLLRSCGLRCLAVRDLPSKIADTADAKEDQRHADLERCD
jgi:hypothetical protein